MEVRSSVPVRKFVRVYKDFLESETLTAEEKLVFIALKSFVEFGRDEDEVYPSMATICKITGMSRPRATRTINSLVSKGIVKKQRRGLTKPNLYTIADYPSMWSAEGVEERRQLLDTEIPYTSDQLISELVRRGVLTEEAVAEKKIEPQSAATDSDPDGRLSIFSTINNITNKNKERQEYTMKYLQELYEYDVLVQRQEYGTEDLDSVLDIIYDALNTTKDTIRINGEEKPAAVVRSKLLKLDATDIEYAIQKFRSVTDRIKNPKAYMLTILYGAKEQRNLDVTNDVSHDLYGEDPD
jgi:hypothetical protein